MRKNLNRLATIALSAMMVAGMAMPAMAAQNAISPDNGKIKFTKTIDMQNVKAAFPTATFEFEIKEGSTDNLVTKIAEGTAEVSLPVVAGPADGLKFASDSDKKIVSDAATGAWDKYLEVDLDQFTKPGVYSYVLSEKAKTENDPTNLTYDTTAYNIYVFVTEEDNVKSAKLEARKSGETVKTDELAFVNKLDADNTFDVVIKKDIEGNAANLTDQFAFTVSVASDVTGEEFTWALGTADQTTKLSSDNAISTTLGEDGSIHIYGLTANDVITVKEDDSNKGYVTSTKNESGIEVTEAFAANDSKDGGEISFKVTAKEATITIENNRTNVTPTGIVMDVAPYVMMLGAAGGLGFAFKSRKREDEE